MSNDSLKILLESRSSNCPLVAIVEESESCTYMYLNKIEHDSIQGILCVGWIRNHHESPSSLDISSIEEGYPSMLASEFCNHPEGKPHLNPEEIECVWFEAGDGVALLEKGGILCIIPSWAGGEIPPYSKDCIKENSLALPLLEENILIHQVRKAQEFWNSWDDDPWIPFRESRIAVLHKYFGEYKNYYAIDGEKWPIKTMLRYEAGDTTYLITIGVSLIPQPTVELFTDAPEAIRRIELGLAIKTEELIKNEMQICSFISAQTTIPWEGITWLGHGHTIECGSIFSAKNRFPYGVFINSRTEPALPQIDFPEFRDDPINILWLTPISEEEFGLVNAEGVDKFLEDSHIRNRSLVYEGSL